MNPDNEGVVSAVVVGCTCTAVPVLVTKSL